MGARRRRCARCPGCRRGRRPRSGGDPRPAAPSLQPAGSRASGRPSAADASRRCAAGSTPHCGRCSSGSPRRVRPGPIVDQRIDLGPPVRETAIYWPCRWPPCARRTALGRCRTASRLDRPRPALGTDSRRGRHSPGVGTCRPAGSPVGSQAAILPVPVRRSKNPWLFPRRRPPRPRAGAGEPLRGASARAGGAPAAGAARSSGPTACAATAAGTTTGRPSTSNSRSKAPGPGARIGYGTFVGVERSESPMEPVAVDAMGGRPSPLRDRGRRPASRADELGIPVMLVGRPDEIGRHRRARGDRGLRGDTHGRRAGLERSHDEGLVTGSGRLRRFATAGPRPWCPLGTRAQPWVRRCCAMGRIRGITRPAIATPIPAPGTSPTTMLDSGANAECRPEWLVQFARMGFRLCP